MNRAEQCVCGESHVYGIIGDWGWGMAVDHTKKQYVVRERHTKPNILHMVGGKQYGAWPMGKMRNGDTQ